MSQPEQPQQVPPPAEVPPPEADASYVMPALLTILAAYVAYRGTAGGVKGTWRQAAKSLGLADLAGNALDNIARRALARQRKSAGRPGDELWMHNEEAVKAGIEAGTQALVNILRNAEPEWPLGSPSAKNGTGGFDPAQVHEMANTLSTATAEAAADKAAELAGWDKIWQSQHDLRVRYSHAFLNRIRVSASEPFVTEDGVHIRFPHDPQAPIAETINCRCHLKYVRSSTRRTR